MSRGLLSLRRLAVPVLISAAVTGCASSRSPAGTGAPSAEPGVTQVASPTMPKSAGLSPTPTYAPTVALGSLTVPLPTGITAVQVTFLRGTGVVYQVSIGDAVTVRQIVDDVNAIHLDTGYTQGCAMSPVTMTMAFIAVSSIAASSNAASSVAMYSEDSGCARASLTVAGSPGPLLDADLTDAIEKLLRVHFDINGSPSVAPAS